MLVLVIYAAALCVVRYYMYNESEDMSGGHPHILMSPIHGHLIHTLRYTHHRHHQYEGVLRVCMHNGSGYMVNWWD